MKVFNVRFDGQWRVVEAMSFGDAVNIWRAGMTKLGRAGGAGPDEDYDDAEPESVDLLSEDPVIR